MAAPSDCGATADSSTQTVVTAPVKTSQRLSFSSLSAELKSTIVDHITLPTDLKNVCLVNKELHAIAVKPLYREVNLDLGSANDSRLSGFLSPNNIGLKHVRQIRLYLANVRDRCNQRNQANFATRMILEFLPRDILDDFRCGSRSIWCPWESFPSENLLLLYRKQRKLNRLEVMDTDAPILPALRKDPQLQKDVFSHATKLALYPENRQTLQTAGFFVKNMADKLQDLIVHTSFDSSSSSSDDDSPTREGSLEPRELNDSATAPGLITSSIFSHLLPFDDCDPLPNLKHLRLNKVNLRYCADSWCKVIDFVQLKSLRLSQCPGADALFAQLSKAHDLPKELKVLDLQLKDNLENDTLHALDGFLCLVSGIADMVIDLQNVKSLPSVAGIARHGKTLETLSIHATPENHLGLPGDDDGPELVYSSEDFEKICKAASGLQQLSCAWPATSLLRNRSDKWIAFENDCLHLKSMVTLHITTWPSTKPSTQSLPKNVYSQLLQGLATTMFSFSELPHGSLLSTMSFDDEGLLIGSSSWPPSKLRVIAFGVSDKQYDRVDSDRQFIFLRSTCLNARGRPLDYATPVGWCLREFIEPRSDVLESDLHHKPRPPCRDREPTAWGDDDELDVENLPVFPPLAPPPPGAIHIHDI